MGALENCDSQLPEWCCATGNAAGYVSSVVWLVVLLPQLWKNWRRHSVHGLSLPWALANFSASLLNMFYVWRLDLPLFTLISALYMPVIEFAILLQFMHYGAGSAAFKAALSCTCVVLWSALVGVEVFVPSATSAMQWIPVALWSIETLFQVYVNERLRSTYGQSSAALLITMIGKCSDAISGFVLVVPVQTYLLTFFSSSTAFINGLQFVAYRFGSPPPDSSLDDAGPALVVPVSSGHGHGDSIVAPSQGAEQNGLAAVERDPIPVALNDDRTFEDGADWADSVASDPHTLPQSERHEVQVFALQVLCGTILSALLVVLAAAVTWRVLPLWPRWAVLLPPTFLYCAALLVVVCARRQQLCVSSSALLNE